MNQHESTLSPSTLPDPIEAVPSFWPSSLPQPPSVRDARAALLAANDAWRQRRLALDAELIVEPQVGLLTRDDPPRPTETRAEWRPGATLAWSPLRSETLLAEARVVEAEAAYAASWREAWFAGHRTPVERARAEARLAEAAREWERLEEAEPDGLERREARLDLEEARLELERVDSAPVLASSHRRHDHPDPQRPEVTRTWRYRARALRLAADVARSERRWTAAVVPLLELEVGYAGSDAELGAELELRGGRPSARAYATLRGTPQERGWATLSAAFRFATDQPDVRAELDAARLAEVRTLAELEEAWNGRAEVLLADLTFARERWRLEEDRLAAGSDRTTEAQARAEAGVLRAYLRYLGAYDATSAHFEAWPPACDGLVGAKRNAAS